MFNAVIRTPAISDLASDLLESTLEELRHLAGEDDSLITRHLMAAIGDVEHQAQVALLQQSVSLTIANPDASAILDLPIRPVAADQVPVVALDGESFTSFDLVPGNRAALRWHDPFEIAGATTLEINYDAGYGATLGDVPGDLVQAVIAQAAHYFDAPVQDVKTRTSSPHMARIAARYRGVSL